MNQKKVYWLLDNVFAQTQPHNWSEVLDLSQRVISIIGNKDLAHEVVNPIESLKKLSIKVEGLSPSTIIDISGWVGYGLEMQFPNTKLITDFSLSRVLDVSTRDFRSAGFVMNLSQEEIKRRAEKLDLSNVIIIDDAAVSGRTNKTVMDVWGISPEYATHAVLFINTGEFPSVGTGNKKEGARSLLEGLGSKVLYGDHMSTPEDDAEHFGDIFNHSDLRSGISAAFRLHDLIGGSANYPEELTAFMSNDDRSEGLFQERVTEGEINKLFSDRRFVPSPTHRPKETSIYSRSPFLWMFSEFWDKIDPHTTYYRREEVLSILQKLQSLQTNQEGVQEIRNSLRNEVRSIREVEGYPEARASRKER